MSYAQPAPAAEPLGRLRVALIATLFALAAVAWVATDDKMGGMDAGPGTDPGTLGFYVSAWVVMMAAMMFPSIVPMVLAYARIQKVRRERGQGIPAFTTSVFVAGYLISWTLFGLAAYGLVELVRSFEIDALSWDRGGPYLAGGVIVAAAIYQLTPAKDACLTRCRSPIDFVMGYWHEGYAGALRMGVAHGAWCVGCCWALMAALFALGVMSIGWMVFVAGLIAIEKLAPWKGLANRAIAVGLAVLGIAVAFFPEHVPGLTIPGSAEANAAMMRMNGRSMDGMKPAKKGGSMGGSMGGAKPTDNMSGKSGGMSGKKSDGMGKKKSGMDDMSGSGEK
jgi:predicted metal-binding membrane protein